MTGASDRTGEPTRALVLGGGGIAGIAWESGLLVGLIGEGVDLNAADLVVGTSAGSTVAVMLRAGLLTPEHLQATLAAPAAAEEASEDDLPHSEESLAFDGLAFGEAMIAAAQGGGDDRAARARIGEWARDTPVSMPLETWLARIGARLPREWPQGALAVTAVDALDGTFRTFGADDGVDVVTAVAASCTVPSVFPLVPIEGRPFMDGGMRSSTNADVAAGHDRVLVVACAPEAPETPYGPVLDAAVAGLRADGSEVTVIEADSRALEIFGTNVLDPATSEPAFLAGLAQAADVAEQVATFWNA